jgi:hypothetical protein
VTVPATDLLYGFERLSQDEEQRGKERLRAIHARMDNRGQTLFDRHYQAEGSRWEFLRQVKQGLNTGEPFKSEGNIPRIVCRHCIGYPVRGITKACAKRVILVRTEGMLKDRCTRCAEGSRKAKLPVEKGGKGKERDLGMPSAQYE